MEKLRNILLSEKSDAPSLLAIRALSLGSIQPSQSSVETSCHSNFVFCFSIASDSLETYGVSYQCFTYLLTYRVLCTVYNIVYISVPCTVYRVQHMYISVPRAVYRVQNMYISVPCTVYRVKHMYISVLCGKQYSCSSPCCPEKNNNIQIK